MKINGERHQSMTNLKIILNWNEISVYKKRKFIISIFASMFKFIIGILILVMLGIGFLIVYSNSMYVYVNKEITKTNPLFGIPANEISLNNYTIRTIGFNNQHGNYSIYVNNLDHNTELTVYRGNGKIFKLIQYIKGL